MNAENMHANLVAAIMYKEVNGKGENFYLAGHYFVLQVATHMCIEPFFNFFFINRKFHTQNNCCKFEKGIAIWVKLGLEWIGHK